MQLSSPPSTDSKSEHLLQHESSIPPNEEKVQKVSHSVSSQPHCQVLPPLAASYKGVIGWGWSHYFWGIDQKPLICMGGGIGPANPATTRPMFSAWCLKCQQMWISKVLNSISALCADNQLLDRGISLITGMEQTIEFLGKANGATIF